MYIKTKSKVTNFGIICLASASLLILVLFSQKNDAVAINVAGRQRMLSQRMSKEALQIYLEIEKTVYLKNLKKSEDLFEKSLRALENGGETDLGLVSGAKSGNAELVKAFDELNQTWSECQKNLITINRGETKTPEFKSALDSFLGKSLILLSRANALTGVLSKQARAKGDLVLFFQIFISALILMGVIYTLFTNNYIINQISKVVKFAEELGKGNASIKRLNDGKAVDCSKVKKCGRESCPSFGKVTNCWVESGSFAVFKTCPKAKAGQDCRKCNIYGCRNELEELNTALNAVADGFKVRAEILNKISEGDLTVENVISSPSDVLGNGLENMKLQLNNHVSDVMRMADVVGRNAGEASEFAKTLSMGASSSAASLEQVTSSMNEIESQTKSNSSKASEAKEMTVSINETINAGTEKMSRMRKAMDTISDGNKEINKIIKVIDDIAFQTNILALNAAVEAARAGRYGKGFAVVAEEVRTLASRSAKAAKDSEDLISRTMDSVENGNRISIDTAETLEKMIEQILKINGLVAQIADSSEEQGSGVKEIGSGLDQINLVTQKNSGISEEMDNATKELSMQAMELLEHLRYFKVEEEEDTLSSDSPGEPSVEFASATVDRNQLTA